MCFSQHSTALTTTRNGFLSSLHQGKHAPCLSKISTKNVFRKKNQRKLHWITCVSPAFPYVTTCNVSSIRTLLTPLGTLTSIYHQPGSLQGGRRHQTLESPHGTRATCTPKTHFRMTTYIQHDFQGVHLMGPVRNSSSSQPA